jgi:hypothetical protein
MQQRVGTSLFEECELRTYVRFSKLHPRVASLLAVVLSWVLSCTACSEIRGGSRPLERTRDAGSMQPSSEADASTDGEAGAMGPARTAAAEECLHQPAGVAFCDADEKMRVCRDRTTAELRDCGDFEHCLVVNDRARCVCVQGANDQGLGCRPASSCDTQAGGCDPLTACTMHGTERVCSACPEGYLGSGESGCQPQLRALTLSCGTLSPELSHETYNYSVRVSVLCPRLQLTASGPSGVRLEIDGDPVSAEAAWTSKLLAIGETPITVRLTSRFGVTTLYKLTVLRDGNQEAYIKASNSEAGDSLGFNVAASGETFVAGAPYEDSASTTDGSDNRAMDSGAAYVFVRRDGAWVQEGYLKTDAPAAGEYLGTVVAVSGDTVVVGAPHHNPLRYNLIPVMTAGAAYVFKRQAGVWKQEAKLVPATSAVGDLFGMRVALDGDTAFVGAPFDSSGGNHSGAVYVFQRSAGIWTLKQTLKPAAPIASSLFGFSLTIAGDTAIIGATEDPSSADKAGSAYFFERRAGMWQEQQRVQAAKPMAGATFGWANALTGDTAVITAGHVDLISDTTPGEAYVFERTAGRWEQSAVLMAAAPRMNDLYGSGLAFDGTTLVIGGNGDSSGARGAGGDPTRSDAYQSGAVHVYSRQGKAWELSAYLKAANTDKGDGFGQVVALAKDTIWVGAPFEAGEANGVNGDASTNGAPASGAIYTFR